MAVTAVIVAAGRGSRLRAGCKPLAIVGGVTLLERALATAQAAGIRRYVVVVGSLDGPVASFCRRRRPDVEVVCAPDHARGNGATVVAGLAHAGGRCLVVMVDHLHEPATLERVLEAGGELVLAVDSRAADVDPDDATLVRREHGAVVAIDKRLASYDAIEAGLAVCSAEPLVELAATLHGDLELNGSRAPGSTPATGSRRSTATAPSGPTSTRPTTAGARSAIFVDRHGAERTDGPVSRVLNRPPRRPRRACGAAVGAATPAAWPWALGAVVANWQLSFRRREHERIAGTLPASHVRWQWRRDVRLLVLAIGCVLLHPMWGLAAAAVVGNLDALRRLVALIRVSREGDRAVACGNFRRPHRAPDGHALEGALDA